MFYAMLKSIIFLIFKFFFQIKIYGQDNLPKKGGFILASNHLSYLDPLVLGVACPRQLNFMARHDLFRNPFFSWLITSVNAFAVKRNSPDLSALKEAMARLRQGKAVVLFPEGSRQVEGLSPDAQPGIGFLVIKTAVPVIPVLISGTRKILPKGARLIRPGKISVHFGKQISLERSMPYQDIAKAIMENIRHLSCKTSSMS